MLLTGLSCRILCDPTRLQQQHSKNVHIGMSDSSHCFTDVKLFALNVIASSRHAAFWCAIVVRIF